MIIAEVAQAHDGSLGMAHAYIEALRHCGVDAVKFQVHIAEAESSAAEPFRVAFSRQDATRYEYWKRIAFTFDQWREISTHCSEAGMEFMASPFSLMAVEWLEALNVRRYKVGSGEVGNWLMLDRIAATGKPVLLSTGLANWQELDETVQFLGNRSVDLTLMQCTTAYPTMPGQWGLEGIQQLRSRYGLPVGFSDHSGQPFACLAAAALGAEVLEFHVAFDRRQFGPDSAASLTIDEVKLLCDGVRKIRQELSCGWQRTDSDAVADLKTIFGKSLAVNKPLPAGHTIQLSDLESKKPGGCGIPARDFERVIGARLRVGKAQWDFLTMEDLEFPA